MVILNDLHNLSKTIKRKINHFHHIKTPSKMLNIYISKKIPRRI